MKRSDINPMPPFFDRYINLVEDVDMMEGFQKYTPEKIYHQPSKLIELGDKIYAENKWTVRDILQHVIDNERIMAYRALRFSRNDKTGLPGYDEELLARHTMASRRTVQDLLDEFTQVRLSTIALFRNMDDAMLTTVGNANQTEISPLALAFVILGHPLHHMRIIEQRYYPLL